MLLGPWAVAALLAATSTLVGALSEHSIVEKSVVQAQQECVEYLNVPRHRLYEYLGHNYANDAKTKCMIRCVGLNLKWWNASVALREDVIRQYFLPERDDSSSIDRTRACIEQRVSPKSTLCSRAFEIFQCYLEHYGELLNCPKTVPLSEERFAEAVHFCLDTLQAPLDEFRSYCSARGFLECERSRCLLRCIAIRTGIYSDQYGAFGTRYQLQFNDVRTNGSSCDGLEQDICTTRLRREGLDKCTLAARVLHECFDFQTTLHTALERSLVVLSPLMEIATPAASEPSQVNKKPRTYNSANKIKKRKSGSSYAKGVILALCSYTLTLVAFDEGREAEIVNKIRRTPIARDLVSPVPMSTLQSPGVCWPGGYPSGHKYLTLARGHVHERIL